MTTEQQIITTLQQENQRLREQVSSLTRERDFRNGSDREADNSAADGHALQAFLTGPVVLFKWAAREGWPVEYVSPNITRFGYTADDFLTGRVTYAAFVHPDDLKQVVAEVDHYSAAGHTCFEQEYYIRNAAGETRRVYDYTTIVRDSQGRITHYVGYILDFTRRKQQEEETRLTRFTIDSTTDQVYWLDMDGRHVYVNNAACTSLGYTREELLQMCIPDIDPKFPAEQWPHIRDQVRQGSNITFESQHRRKDGSVFPVEVAANYLVFNEREYICAFARNITERKRQEEELRIFKALADNALDGVAMASLEGRLIYANPAFQAMSGLGEQTLGTHVLDLYSQEIRPFVEHEVITDVMQQGAWQGVLELCRPDGSRWLAQHSAFALRDETGQVSNMANLLRDITELKQQEAERAALQKQIIEAQRETLRELSTPLIPISDDVVIMPIIGTLDSQRAQQVMEALLEGVAKYQAQLVILDITGVPVVDTQVAQALLQAARAVRLLGAHVMLTGIQPQIAQTLVHLGVDLSGIQTQSSLQAGIAVAIKDMA